MAVAAANPFVIGAAVVASVGAGIGGFAVARAIAPSDDPATAEVTLYACPEAGAPAIGAAAPGDQVWVVGRTGDRWAVVRLPDDPTRTAWMPLDAVAVDGDASLLPELDCAPPDPGPTGPAISVPASTAPPSTTAPASAPSTATTAPASSAPTSPPPPTSAPSSTLPAATTTAAATTTTTPAVTTIAATTTVAPTTTAATTTAAPTTVTTTTVPPDTTPPGAVVTPDRTTFYDVNGDPACVDVLFVSVAPTDDRSGAALTGVVARWSGQAGPAEVALAADAGRYRLEVFSNPPATSAIVTITASVRDAAGNAGTGAATVTLLNAGSNGCVVG